MRTARCSPISRAASGCAATLFTLTRGEGGQNAMSADSDDALGMIRTNELLKADEFYGAKQLWGTEVDFGFSKTQEESFARWGHDRVLYDAVLAVRTRAAAGHRLHICRRHHRWPRPAPGLRRDRAGGLQSRRRSQGLSRAVATGQGRRLGTAWQPLAVYRMVPFAPVTEKGMFDYATGKWAPAKFHNYVTGEWITGVPSTDVTIPVGELDPTLGRSYVQIAREGWGEQKSQNGGANPTLSGPADHEISPVGCAPQPQAKPATPKRPKTRSLPQQQSQYRYQYRWAWPAGRGRAPDVAQRRPASDRCSDREI